MTIVVISIGAQQNKRSPLIAIDPIVPPPLYIDEIVPTKEEEEEQPSSSPSYGLAPPPVDERQRRFVQLNGPPSAYSDPNVIGNGAELNGNQPYNTGGGACSVCGNGGYNPPPPPPPPPPPVFGPWSEWSQCSSACNACGTSESDNHFLI